MSLSDIIAALQLLEGLSLSQATNRVEQAAREATPQAAAVIYGDGGWHRYFLEPIGGESYRLVFSLRHIQPIGEREILAALRDLNISTR